MLFVWEEFLELEDVRARLGAGVLLIASLSLRSRRPRREPLETARSEGFSADRLVLDDVDCSSIE